MYNGLPENCFNIYPKSLCGLLNFHLIVLNDQTAMALKIGMLASNLLIRGQIG